MAELGQISNVYGDDPYKDFYSLSNLQSRQSLNAGDIAARYSDPYAEQRQRDIQSLRLLESNPGSIETSPFYKFLMDQQLNAVQSKNAATGQFRSGRGAMALQDRAAGVASQSYFPLLNNLTQRAISGSSPTAAGVTYERGVRASQDQAQMAAASRAASRSTAPQFPSYSPPQVQAPAPVTTNYGLPYSNTSSLYGGLSGQVDYNTPGYTPSADAGTGYVLSDLGASDVNGPGSQYYSYGSPATDTGAFDPYASSDFGYGGDYG